MDIPEILRRVPSRGSSPREIDLWNQAWRTSPLYQEMFRLVKGTPGRALSDDQRRNMLSVMRSYYGVQIPSGMEFDQAGNLNQANTKLERGLKATALGAFGTGAAGALGAFGGSPAPSASGTLPSSHLPVEALMGGAPAIASQGVSAGAGGAAAAGASGGIGSAFANAGKSALQNLMTPGGMASLAPLIASLANRGGSGTYDEGANNQFLQNAYNDAKRVQAMQEARYRRTDPLHEAVTQLAFNRMPVNSRQGVTLNKVPFPG